MPANTVKRKIYFYRVILEDGSGDLLNVTDCLNAIGGLAGQSRNYMLSDGRAVCAWAEDAARGRIVLGLARSRELPLMEQDGNRAPLPLTADQRLLESTHIVLFRDGIAGAEYNFYGPRIFKLRDFLANQCPALPPIRFDPLTDRKVAQRLRDLETITCVQVRVHRDYLDLLRQSQESLANAFGALEEMTDAPVVEVILRQEPHKRESLGEKAQKFVNDLVGQPLVREASDTLKVRGRDARTGKSSTFDFLRDQFAYATDVVLQDARSRCVDAQSMFTAIEEAYNIMHDDLVHAMGLEI